MTPSKLGIIALISVVFVSSSLDIVYALPDAKITVKVVGEDGQPVEGAEVGTGFERNTGFGTEKVPQKGFSDANGLFTANYSTTGYISYGATKEGFYDFFGTYRFKEKKFDHWEPWNPTVRVILRKIEKPVPMFARDTKKSGLELPVAGKAIGFDLMAYDWITPYGNGKHADFMFKLEGKFLKEDDFDYTLTITFLNKFDGIQLVKENRSYGSVFKLPRTAPQSGYQAKLVHRIQSSPGKPISHDFEEDNNYIFRLRSEEKNGKFVRAMYGKIHGDIKFYPLIGKTARIHFKYFLNPDYTRNLEFDPSRNLFENLKSVEQVGIE